MKLVALAGGVGGAKLTDGLAQLLPPENLTIVVNTGDDFEHLGLYISPDLDTVCYTLAGLANPKTGWGRAGETYHLLESLAVLGGETWFRLGDKDLATHLERTRRLHAGETLSHITRLFCRAWGVRHTVLPMSDDSVRTMVETVKYGELSFQEYFVHQRCEPKVKGFRFVGIESARAAPGVLEAIEMADAVVLCPSNPWVSIDPILAVAGIRSALEKKKVVAVSPIIGGKTVKGPAAKMYSELGVRPSALAVAEHYSGLLTGFVMDQLDAKLAEEIPITTMVTDILMPTQDDRRRLAQDVLDLIRTL
ncbi:MAG: 2-phospho-L-lactate transferase [Chloroflexi bacterium]|nr:2-phospho-L-lactate transferase [Chloroflexota bacterium]